MMSKDRSKEKTECFDEWMKADHVLVHLDSRVEGVEVPESHQENPALTLQLSYAFRGETTRDEHEIRSYLKFQGNYFECVIPWRAVWGISSSEGDSQMWPHDMPKELLVQFATSKLQAVGKKLFGKSKSDKDKVEEPSRPKPQLADVSASTKPETPSQDEKEHSSKEPRPKPSLKRVK